jgi:chemotaxis protein MotB
MRTLFLPSGKKLALTLFCAAAAATSGCRAVPYAQHRQAQIRSMHMYQQNRMMASQLHETRRMAAQLQAEKQQLEMATNQLNGSLQIANQRLGNLNDERTQLHEKYKGLLTGLQAPGSGIPDSTIDRFRALSQKHPEFQFDPVTGVSKFTGELLFATGSDALRPESHRLLQEFTQIMNTSDARSFKILVVGHTDDRPVVQPGTKQRHPTNWDLSAHRATAVVKQLASFGLDDARMGIAGYSKHQPALPNRDEASRQQNRRVEIYVLAPDAQLAGGP